jgi:hypothetical protein
MIEKHENNRESHHYIVHKNKIYSSSLSYFFPLTSIDVVHLLPPLFEHFAASPFSRSQSALRQSCDREEYRPIVQYRKYFSNKRYSTFDTTIRMVICGSGSNRDEIGSSMSSSSCHFRNLVEVGGPLRSQSDFYL